MLIKEQIADIEGKIYDGAMAVLASRDYLPDSFADDMKELFGTDPEKEILTQVEWEIEIEWRQYEGVIALTGNDLSKEEVCDRLVKYAKKKDIPELHLLYKEGNFYYEDDYDSSEDSFEKGREVNYGGDTVLIDGMENIFINNSYVKLGFE